MKYAPKTLVQTKTLFDLSNEFKILGQFWERRKIDLINCTVYYDQLSLVTDRRFIIDAVDPESPLPYHATELGTGKKARLHEGIILKPLLYLVKCEITLDELLMARQRRAKQIQEKNRKVINNRNIPRA